MKSRFGRHHRRAKALGPILLASAAALSATDRAAAVNKAWAVSGSGSWNVAGNWSPAGQPQAGDVAMLLSSAADDRLVTYVNTSNPGADLNAVRIDATGAGRMELHFVPAFAHGLRADEMQLGINGRGWVDQSAGTVTLVGGLYVGAAFAGAGTYTIRGGRLSAFEAFVGDFGAGALVQTGGNVDVDDRLVLGFDGTGTHALSGGTVTTNQLVVGYGGNGTLDQTGGVVDTVQVNLGQSGGAGRYNLGGTGALVTDQLYLGFGTFAQTGGRNTAGAIVLGKDASGNGTYTISGGTLSATQVYVGGAGRGVLNHLGGFTNASGTLAVVGTYAGAGTINLSGGTISAPIVEVGHENTPGAALNQTGGTLAASRLDVGANVEANAWYRLQDGTVNVPTQFIGRLGLATFIHSGGVNNAASGLTVGDPANGGFGRYEMSGGTLNAGAVTIRGALDQTGGSVSAANVGGGGSLRVAGGTFVANHVRTSTLAVDGGVLRVRPNGGAGGTSRTSQLTMARLPGGAPLGTIDLSDNDLVVDYTGASPLGDVASAIRSAHHGGAWTGTGVTSSAAAASAFSAVKTALAYAEATDLFTTFPSTFSGQSIDTTSVLVRYTAYGDANLDGTVNLTDFNALAANFGTAGGATWVRGDFDYDGNVNLADFNLLAGNFGQAVGGPTVTPEDWSALAAAVPEPAGFATLFSGFALCARRRQRQR